MLRPASRFFQPRHRYSALPRYAVRSSWWVLAGWVLVTCVLVTQGNASDQPNDALALLTERCAECHNTDDPNGGINFDRIQTLAREADSGEIPVVPGKVDASELVRRIESNDTDLQMPPEGERLTEQEVARIKSWIKSGATSIADNSDGDSETPLSDHWSFQPIGIHNPPEVEDHPSLSPIDRFLTSRRRADQLWQCSTAKPHTLVRRASYALTGLPPSPGDIDAFEREVARHGSVVVPMSNLVDSLLSRKSYGERWGRHWMDWVRYADTAGDNSDFPIPEAYLYRNYIIDSINDDVPYDQFLTEQIAGDLLPAKTQEQRKRQLIATGYLAMARRFGSLVETYPWHLTIEDTIDNLGRTTMGLTLSCARCHDHKFDPISTRDYYGLYGIFASTQYSFPGIELFQVQKDMVPLLPTVEVSSLLANHRAETDKLTMELERRLEECRERELENARLEPGATIAQQRKMHDDLQRMLKQARNAGTELAKHLKELPAIPVAYGVADAKGHDAKIQIKGEPTRPGASVRRRFPTVLGGQEVRNRSASGRLELAGWITNPANPLTARVIVNRVWQRHFGVGLVESTSDFGLRGSTPSHPELLDWLANDFMEHGWSLKHLHRIIMNSEAYQLASKLNSVADVELAARNRQRDPENRFLWRFRRHRLDAESIRDTLLVAAGNLDDTPQTEPYPIPPQKEWEYTQHHPFKDDYPSLKRSVYQMTKRLTVESYMQTFDGADPNVCTSDRDQSVTALQALYFVNDEFLHSQAELIAKRLIKEHEDQRARLLSLYQLLLGRSPTQEESKLLMEHLDRIQTGMADGEPSELTSEKEVLGWSSLVRSVLRLNEFLYVD